MKNPVTNRSTTLLTLIGFTLFFSIFFLPATLGKLMASGDAVVESLPAIFGKHHLWEDSILLGYPMYADPNQQMMYPLAWAASALHAYNAFAVAPFVIAAFGMWGLVRSFTGSRISGIVAALVYALGGFMISHAGHLMIVHPAAWAPYIFWSFDAQRKRRNPAALAGGALAIGLCAVSGQPEVLAFAIAVAVAYVCASVRGTSRDRRFYFADSALTLLLGFGFAAVQLVPEAVLAHESTRSTIDVSSFVFLQIPVTQILTRIVFPYAMGVSQLPGFPFSRADYGFFTEETVSVGTISLLLAALSFSRLGADRRILFWLAIAAIGLVLAIGDATPLPRLTHALPVYGLLRIPGRHAFEWTIAIAVLSGYGALAIRQGSVSLRRFALGVVGVTILTALAYLQFISGESPAASFVAGQLAASIDLVRSPLVNGALGFPIASAILEALLLTIAILLRSKNRLSGAIITLAVLIDMSAFAYPAYWNWAAVTSAALNATPLAVAFESLLKDGPNRVAWAPGNARSSAFPPNLTTLWGVATVDGYSPLIPQRTEDLLGTTPAGGGVPIPASRDVTMDLAGVSIYALPTQPVVSVTAHQPFAPDSSPMFFSQRHRTGAMHVDLGLAEPFSATRLAMVSELGESMDVPQHVTVGTFSIQYIDGRSETHDVIAGRDTAEFAFDRADVRPKMRHARASVFADVGVGHTYVSQFALHRFYPIRRIAFDWTYPTAALTIEDLSLVDDRSGAARAFNAIAPLYAFPEHWQPIRIDPSVEAFRNLRVMPLAWIARPILLPEDEAVEAIHRGQFSSGSPFDSRHTALISEPVRQLASPVSSDRVGVESTSSTDVIASTTCLRPCFAVFRNAFDGAWKADVDGSSAPTLQTDVDLRGVVVPAGTHRVHFRFYPAQLYVGAFLALLSALVSMYLLAEYWSYLGAISRSRHGHEQSTLPAAAGTSTSLL